MDLLNEAEAAIAVNIAMGKSDEWEETVEKVLSLPVGKGARLYAEDYGYKDGTVSAAEFPSRDDVARLRSLMYSRGLLINAYRQADDDGTRYVLVKISGRRGDR